MLGPDPLTSYLLQAEVVLIQDGVYDLQLQKPVEVAGLILEFLGRNRFGRQSPSELSPSVSPQPSFMR